MNKRGINLYAELTEQDIRDQAQARQLHALASPIRLRILALLLSAKGTMCVQELTDAIGGLQQPTISHHLRILRDTGLLFGRSQGLHRYYQVHAAALASLANQITDLAKPPAPERPRSGTRG